MFNDNIYKFMFYCQMADIEAKQIVCFDPLQCGSQHQSYIDHFQ